MTDTKKLLCYRHHAHRDREQRVLVQHLVTTERRLICEGCGREFGCARDNIGACWCNAEPYRLPMPAPGSGAADCLCPDCLRQAASKLKASAGAAGPG